MRSRSCAPAKTHSSDCCDTNRSRTQACEYVKKSLHFYRGKSTRLEGLFDLCRIISITQLGMEMQGESFDLLGKITKIPGAGERHFFKNRPGAPGILYGFGFASPDGFILPPAGVRCFPRGIFRRSGDWASCRKSLPPLGGVLPEVAISVWGASCRKGFLCLERALPNRVISSSARCP